MPKDLIHNRNPFQFSDDPQLELTKLDTQISSQKIVPSQRAPYIQTLFNPSYPEEIITVQYCNVVKLDEQDINLRSELQLTKCSRGNCSGMMMAQHFQKDRNSHCVTCNTRDMERYFKCSVCNKDITCPQCNLTNFKRNMLKRKVNKYFKKDSYRIMPAEQRKDQRQDMDQTGFRSQQTNAGDSSMALDTQVDQELTETQTESQALLQSQETGVEKVQMTSYAKDKNFRKLYDQTKQREEKGTTVHQFAILQKEVPNESDDSDDDETSYVLVAFWRYEMSNYVCYKVTRIDNPLFSEPAYDLSIRTFLHLAEDGRGLFYFAEATSKIMALYWLETKQDASAYSYKQEPLNYKWKTTVEQQQRIDLNENQLLNRNVDVQMLFKIIFDTHLQADATAIMKHNVMPNIVEINKQLYLVLKAKWAINPQAETQSQRWFQTSHGNLFFISLQTDQIVFTIYNADLFIGIFKQDFHGQQPIDTILFLRRREIVQMEFGRDEAGYQIEEGTMYSKQRASIKSNKKIMKIYPCNCWNDEEDFMQKNEEFGNDLDDALKRATMMSAKIHKEQSRVSILYQGVGLFTYELQERDSLTFRRRWTGTVGDHLISFTLEVIKHNQNGQPNVVQISDFVNEKDPADEINKKTTGHLSEIPGSDGQQFDLSIQMFINEKYQPKLVFSGIFDIQRATFTGAIENKAHFRELFLISNPELHSKAQFSFKGLDHADQAYMYFNYEIQRDVVFCQSAPNGHLYASGDAKLKVREIEPGYSSFRMEVYDLDKDIYSSGQERIKELDEKIKLECLIPSSFEEAKDQHGIYQMPKLILAPLRLVWESRPDETRKDIEKKIMFNTQMFYQNNSTLKTNTLFLQGRSAKDMKSQSKNHKKLLFPQWIATPLEERIISYPLLCYKSISPMDNEFVVCNLAQNEPLKVVNIYPYRFIQFIEMGMNSERYASKTHAGKAAQAGNNSTIYFLVGITSRDPHSEHNNRTVMRIMCYQHFPYTLNRLQSTKLKDFFFKEPQIGILSGEIDLNDETSNNHEEQLQYNYDLNKFTKEKIRAATIIQREIAEGIAMLLVMQLVDGVLTFNMNTGDVWFSGQKYPDCKMLKFQMQRSPYAECYFAEHNESSGCDQIVRLQYQGGDEPTKTVAINMMGEELLALSVKANGSAQTVKSHAIYLIDSDYLFEKYLVEDSEAVPVVVTTVNLKDIEGIPSVLRHLQNSEWNNTVVLHNRGIIAMDEVNHKLQSATINFNGAFSQHQEFLGFDEIDRKQRRQKTANKVLNVSMIPWMNATINEIEEGDFNYLLVENEIFSRKIELMRQDKQLQLTGGSKIVMIGNAYIAVKVAQAKQYLLFTQKHQMCVDTLCYDELEPATNVTNNIQFFYATKTKTRNRGTVNYLIKFKGETSSTYKPMTWDLTQISQDLVQQLWDRLIKNDADIDDYNMFDSADEAHDQHLQVKNKQKKELNESVDSGLEEVVNMGKDIKKNFMDKFKTVEPLKYDIYHLSMHKNDKILTAVAQNNVSFFYLLNVKENCQRPARDYKKLFMGFKFDNSVFQNEQTVIHECAIAFDFCDVLDRAELNSLHFFYTTYYLVICTCKNIYWVKRSDLNTLSENESFDAHYESMPFEEFADSVKEFGFRAFRASSNQVHIAEKGEFRPNVIQVSFAALTVLWCLDENKEVIFAERVDQFESHKKYVQMGMLPHCQRPQADSKNMSEAVFVQENEKATLMTTLPSKNLLTGCIFRNFSLIELYEVLQAKRQVQNNLYVPKIDLETTLANFNGKSFWEVFLQYPDFLQMVESEITERDLQGKKSRDEAGKETDNILIRRIFWSLQVPIKQIHNNKYGILGQLQTHHFDKQKQKPIAGKIVDPNPSDDDDFSDMEEALNKQIFKVRNRYTQTCVIDRSFHKRISDRLQRSIFPQEYKKKLNRIERGTIAQFRHPAKSVTQEVLEKDNFSHLLDPFLKLMMLSSEVRLSNLAPKLDQLKLTLKLGSTQIQEFRERAMFENELSKDMETVGWIPGDEMVTFQSNHSLLGKEQITKMIIKTQLKKLEKKSEQLRNTFTCTSRQDIMNWRKQWKKSYTERKISNVQVKILEIESLSKREQFVQFYKFLQKLNDDHIYKNSLIRTILSKTSISWRIYTIFIAFVAQFASCSIYFGRYLFEPQTERYTAGSAGGLRVAIHVISCFFAFVEWNNQVYSESKTLQERLYNFNQIAILGMTNYIVIFHGYYKCSREEISELSIYASFTVVALWCQMFTWMRISKSLSFYVTMIWRTFVDLSEFLILFLICVMMFANAMFIINKDLMLSVDEDGLSTFDGVTVVEPLAPVATGSPYPDAMIDQWKLGLGDFQTDAYGQSGFNGSIVWAYFLAATFFTQIIFLNMLIAIMTKTFNEVTDAQAQILLRSKTMLYIDYGWVNEFIVHQKLTLEKRYLYVITPVSGIDAEETANEVLLETLDGANTQVKLNDRKTKRIERTSSKIANDVSDLQKQLIQVQERFSEQDKSLKDILQTIKQGQVCNVSSRSPQVGFGYPTPDLALGEPKESAEKKSNLKKKQVKIVEQALLSSAPVSPKTDPIAQNLVNPVVIHEPAEIITVDEASSPSPVKAEVAEIPDQTLKLPQVKSSQFQLFNKISSKKQKKAPLHYSKSKQSPRPAADEQDEDAAYIVSRKSNQKTQGDDWE